MFQLCMSTFTFRMAEFLLRKLVLSCEKSELLCITLGVCHIQVQHSITFFEKNWCWL